MILKNIILEAPVASLDFTTYDIKNIQTTDSASRVYFLYLSILKVFFSK